MDITENRDFNFGIARDILARTFKDIEKTINIVSNKEDIDILKGLHAAADMFSEELENASKTDNLMDFVAVINEIRTAVFDISESPRNREAKERQRVKELSADFHKLGNNAQEILIDGFYSARKNAMLCILRRDFSNIDSHINSMFTNYLLEHFRSPSMQEDVFNIFCKKEHLTFEPEEYRKLIKQGKQALEECNGFEVVKIIIQMSQLMATEPSNEMIISAINDAIEQRKC